MTESAVTQKTGMNFEIGEKVKVCDGPFLFNGLIEEIDEEKSNLKCQFLYLVELHQLI